MLNWFRTIVTYEVVTQELHDERRVLVALLGESVELCVTLASCSMRLITQEEQRTGNSLVERRLRHLAGLIWRVEDLVVEYREVEGQAETDWVCGCELGGSDLGCSLVGLERLVGGVLALVGGGELGEVAVVVTLPVRARRLAMYPGIHRLAYAHLVVEDLGLATLCRRDQVLV